MINGLDDLSNSLNKLKQNAERINGNNSVPFSELFNSSFMLQHTQNAYSSFSEFLNASKFANVPFEEIPDDELDKYIADNTDFQSWKDMQTTASKNWVTKQLGL